MSIAQQDIDRVIEEKKSLRLTILADLLNDCEGSLIEARDQSITLDDLPVGERILLRKLRQIQDILDKSYEDAFQNRFSQ
jgi:hypothetical protein